MTHKNKMDAFPSLIIISLLFHYILGIEVTGPPASTYVALSSTAVLSCFVTDHSAGNVAWSKFVGASRTDYFTIFFGGVVTPDQVEFLPDKNDYTVTVDPVGSTDYWANMTIATVDSDDPGQYSCWTGSVDDGGELVLAAPPSSVVISDNSGGEVEVTEGVAQTLTCTADNSKPQVSIQWTIDGSSVAADSITSTENGDGTFTTTSVMTYTYTHAAHQGKSVECVATNLAGNEATSVTLNVLVGPTSPEMSDRDGDYPNGSVATVLSGTEHYFSCVARGANPAATITWYLNGAEVTDQASSTTSPISGGTGTLHDTTSTLTFTPTYSSQGHLLTCRATNTANEPDGIDTSVILEVYVSPGDSDVSIVGHSAGEMVTVLYNTLLNLTCQVNGVNPAASITWYNDDEDVTEQSQPTTTQSLDGLYNTESVLTFTPTKSDQNNTIQCQASHCTLLDPAQFPSTSIQLNVDFPAKITNPNEDNEFVDEGGEAVLRCEAEGNPPPDFTWTKDNTVITGGEDHIDLDESDPGGFNRYSTLTIDSVDRGKDYGDYVCTVKNTHGEDSLTINLDGTTKPEPATGINVTEATDTALTVTWVEGQDGGHPQTFTVEYRVVGSGADWEDSQAVDASLVTLNDLQPQTQYEIRVKSENTLGFVYSEEPFTYDTKATPTQDPEKVVNPPSDDTPIIIGVVVGGVLLIAIIILVVLIFRRKGESKTDHEMNPYVDDTRRFLNEGASSSDTPNIYAEVKKDGKSKPKKSDKTPTNPPDSEQAPQLPPPFIGNGEELVSYENAYGKRSDQAKKQVPDENPYEVTEKPQEEKQNKNPDGLVYAELDLKTPPKAISQKPTPQHGETTYASIDFNKKAPGGSGLP